MFNRIEEDLQQITQIIARLEKQNAKESTIEPLRLARDRLMRELKLKE
jgi:hypothetical protein